MHYCRSKIGLGKKPQSFIITLKALELQICSNEAIYKEISNQNNIERREISDQEIIDRCILALVNEGARIWKKV